MFGVFSTTLYLCTRNETSTTCKGKELLLKLQTFFDILDKKSHS